MVQTCCTRKLLYGVLLPSGRHEKVMQTHVSLDMQCGLNDFAHPSIFQANHICIHVGMRQCSTHSSVAISQLVASYSLRHWIYY